MRADLEQRLWLETRSEHRSDAAQPRRTPREVIAEMVADGSLQNPKQALPTLGKWARRGWYDYGVTLDLGWKTGKGGPDFEHMYQCERGVARARRQEMVDAATV